ncbi:MAG: SRPBCC family protein [Candidatus Dormibacteria bacterium]
MPEASARITVPASVERAWDFAADVRNAPLWVSGVRQVSGDLGQPLRPGDRLQVRLVAGGKVADSVWEIDASERPDFLSSHGRALGAHAFLHIACQPRGPRLTEVLYQITYQLPGGPLGALAARLGVQGVLELQARRSLRTLRRLLRNQAQPRPQEAHLEPGEARTR